MTRHEIPEMALVALVGVSGSGKSTFAARHFGRYEVVSSDVCRGLVSNDENDQAATKDAFDVLGFIVGKRLAAGLLTVVDATNVQREARRQVVELAKAHDVMPVAIVLDVPESIAVQRNRGREDRDFGARVIHRQHEQLRRYTGGLAREGFRHVIVLRGEEIDDAEIVRVKMRVDRSELTGPFDVIGDVHGCATELIELLERLGYAVVRDAEGRAVDAVHADGRTVIFLGDLVDRGPDSPAVLRLAMGMTAAGHALAVPGNHESKLVRALAGRAVQVSHGLAETLAQLAGESAEFVAAVSDWCDSLVSHLVLDGGRLVVAHAGLKEAYHRRASGRVRGFALYGDTTGESDEFGLPVRYPWARDYRGAAMVLYGHTPVTTLDWVNNTLCLDTGCVFGGSLSALRYPEKEVVQVRAARVYHEPTKPLGPMGAVGGAGASGASGGVGGAGGSDGSAGASGNLPDADAPGAPVHPDALASLVALAPPRADADLDISDVLGVRTVETAHHGRISIRAELAAGALEVMGRFAMAPGWMGYLPPTMAPVSTSPRPDYLEHPDEAFTAYGSAGIETVICEEKHMGSRAVVVVCRDESVAARRFGALPGESGAIYTRTGPAFFEPPLTEQLLGRVRAALDASGLWDELGSDWLVFDTEMVPWSIKADQLIREQYAGVGTSGRAHTAAAFAAVTEAAAAGLDMGELAARLRAREADLDGYVTAYRRYRWDVNGLEGVQVAPFQLLAGEDVTWTARDHRWQLELIDRLVAADPVTFRTTRRLAVDTGRTASTDAGVRWWGELTAGGGEGMVVKPAAALVRSGKGLVQPGLKVRGREYLRLIYGPAYLEPENLSRLKNRDAGRKRALASREYALGLEALDRLARGEPLWRVHEAVFAVLALESDPVDPRL